MGPGDPRAAGAQQGQHGAAAGGSPWPLHLLPAAALAISTEVSRRPSAGGRTCACGLSRPLGAETCCGHQSCGAGERGPPHAAPRRACVLLGPPARCRPRASCHRVGDRVRGFRAGQGPGGRHCPGLAVRPSGLRASGQRPHERHSHVTVTSPVLTEQRPDTAIGRPPQAACHSALGSSWASRAVSSPTTPATARS